MSTHLSCLVIRRVMLPEVSYIIELRAPDLIGIRVRRNGFTRYTTFTALYYHLLLPKPNPRFCRLIERQHHDRDRVTELTKELVRETNSRVYDGGDRFLIVTLRPPDRIGLRTTRRSVASTRWIRTDRLHKLLKS